MVPLMSESMERSLGLMAWLQLKLHLIVCAWCARYLAQLRLIRQLLRQMPNQTSSDLSSLLGAEARQRINTSLRKQ
jgi:hypothetical protein